MSKFGKTHVLEGTDGEGRYVYSCGRTRYTATVAGHVGRARPEDFCYVSCADCMKRSRDYQAWLDRRAQRTHV